MFGCTCNSCSKGNRKCAKVVTHSCCHTAHRGGMRKEKGGLNVLYCGWIWKTHVDQYHASSLS